MPEFRKKSITDTETTAFGDDGICDACKYAEYKKTIDWAERERQLREVCDRYRRDDGRYDVIVPGSGGKDSIFVSHLLKTKYNMNPLIVTWAPHAYTDIGWRNVQAWQQIGFDHSLFTHLSICSTRSNPSFSVKKYSARGWRECSASRS